MSDEVNQKNANALRQSISDLQTKHFSLTNDIKSLNANLTMILERLASLEKRLNLSLSTMMGNGSTVK